MKFTNLVEMFEKSCQAYGSRDLFGTKRDGAWHWTSYAEIKRRVDDARAGLASLGVAKGDKVAIIANNRIEWAVMAYATYGLGAAFVPMYEAQQADEWEFIARDCESKVLVVASKKIFDKVKGFPDTIDTLKRVICLEGDEPETSYKWLLDEGKKKPVEPSIPDTKDLAGLIYTSGTTGHPKGVLLSHGNFSSNVSAVHEIFPMEQGDRSLSFLPWAHSFGQTCELHCLISMGASIALNSAVENLVAEMAEVRPTLLFSVPRIFNRLYDVINKGVAEKPAPIQALFKRGLAAASAVKQKKPLGLLDKLALGAADKLIFSKARARLGGRLRFAFSGGAALSKDVAEFIDNLGIMVYEGYGLTETSPIATANSPKNGRKIGSIGKPIPQVRVEVDKKATGDDVNGEIIIHGPNVMQGYYKRDEENAKVLMADGGFRTGDMGHVDADGFLWITGRIKEQYKLENGKYVVPSPLEEQLKLSPFITNAMIFGDNKPFNVSLLVPDRDVLAKWAASQGLGSYESLTKDEKAYETLLTSAKVREKMGQELESASKEFRSFDRAKKFVEWYRGHYSV
ncbi:MAG: long-chain fatty acid--CoA ligase [Myxococcales bacterium]|nr:MAG: long-chain fatty acid--CoA ligase [Myxococcales bacterium]